MVGGERDWCVGRVSVLRVPEQPTESLIWMLESALQARILVRWVLDSQLDVQIWSVLVRDVEGEGRPAVECRRLGMKWRHGQIVAYTQD